MIKGQVRIFLGLLGEVRGVGGKLKFARTIISAQRKGRDRADHPTVDIPFRPFKLRFGVGQGELQPYLDLKGEIRQLVAHIPGPVSDWVVMDVGANIGLFSLFLKDAKRIIAVEPNPDCCERIRHNFAANAVHGTVVPKAIHSEVTTLRLSVGAGTTVMSAISEDGNLEVPATTVDALIAEFQLSRVDLLKLDVESHEIDALRGAAKALKDRRIRSMYIEAASPAAMQALDAHLLPLGYKRSLTMPYNALYEIAR